MLLFDPSPGQIVDRMFILTLKHREARKAGHDASALAFEFDACCTRLQERSRRLPFEPVVRLARLKQRLFDLLDVQWGYENEIRSALKDLPADKPYDALLNIWRLEEARMTGNNERAQLVQEIDTLFGLPPEPKFYAQ